jgi:hypothetical protein
MDSKQMIEEKYLELPLRSFSQQGDRQEPFLDLSI